MQRYSRTRPPKTPTLNRALGELLARTAERIRDGTRSPETLRMQEAHAVWLRRRLGASTPLRSLAERQLDELAADRRSAYPGRVICARTIQKRLSTLRSAMRLAHRRELLARVPLFPELSSPPRPRRRIFATFADYRRLYAELPRHRAEWLALCFWTAQHASDVDRMTWADVDFGAEPPAITIRNTKTRKPDGIRVKCPRPLLAILRAMRRRRRPLATDRIVRPWPNRGYMLPAAAARVGLPRMNAIDLRHAALSVMVRRLGLTRAAQEWGGWADYAMMSRYYAHALPAGLAEASDELSSWADPATPARARPTRAQGPTPTGSGRGDPTHNRRASRRGTRGARK